MTITAMPSSRPRQDLALTFPLVWVQGHLHGVEAARTERPRELSESARRVMRDAEPIAPPSCALLLKPLHVLLPRDQIVDLLDLAPTEPFALPSILLAALLDAACPDLRRN